MKIRFRWRWRILFLVALVVYSVFLLTQFHPRNFKWERKPLPIPVEDRETVTRFTKNFSYTESDQGRPLLTVDAEEVVAFKNTEYNLRNAHIIFYLKSGKVTLFCREARFNVETKDAFVKGRVVIRLPNGISLWTEEVAYHHPTRDLEGSMSLRFEFMDFYRGEIASVHMNLRDEVFTLQQVRVEGPDAGLQTPVLTGSLKMSSYSFPSGVNFFWQTHVFLFRTLTIHTAKDTADVDGTCMEGELGLDFPYALSGERFTGQLDVKPQLRMRAWQVEDGVTLESPEGGRLARAKRLDVQFDGGHPATLAFKEDVFFQEKEQEIHAATAAFTLDAAQKLDSAYFGDGTWGCVQGWYYSSETLQYLPKQEAAFLRHHVHTRNRGMVLDGAWVHVMEGGNKVEAGGGVFAKDESLGYSVKSQDMDLNRKEKRTTFRTGVLAWSAQNTLKSNFLTFFQDRWEATGAVDATYDQGKEKYRLTCWTLTYDSAHHVLDALDSVNVTSSREHMAGYHLLGYEEGGKLVRLVLTDGVYLELKDQGQKGTGDELEANLKQNFFVLEGCPAVLEAPKEGRVESSVIFGLQDPLQIFLLDENGKALIQQKQAPGKAIVLTIPEKGKKKPKKP